MLPAAADQSLNKSFDAMVRVEGLKNEPITINGRAILARRVHDGIAWFEFDELCDGPRSQYDYIELSKIFHTVFLSDVPKRRKKRS